MSDQEYVVKNTNQVNISSLVKTAHLVNSANLEAQLIPIPPAPENLLDFRIFRKIAGTPSGGCRRPGPPRYTTTF